MGSAIPKAVLIDIRRCVSFGPKANLAALGKLPVTSFMKLLQKETKHVYQERRKLSILDVLDAKVTGLTKAV